jgi:hypothetical protein
MPRAPTSPSHCATSGTLVVIVITLLGALASRPSMAAPGGDDSKPDTTRFKFTPSWYSSSDGNDAVDLNLRAKRGPHTAWVGYYHDRSGYRQPRTGYEYTLERDWLHVVGSAQAANRGFLGGSINAQFGNDYYAIAGFGRTNTRPYVNLNFDPNDAITLGVGTKAIKDTEISLYHIRDDRLDTQQRVTHFLVHRDLSDQRKVSLDTAWKSGLNSDNVPVHGYQITLTYAVGDVFFRLARDQFANFGTATQTRFSLGRYF